MYAAFSVLFSYMTVLTFLFISINERQNLVLWSMDACNVHESIYLVYTMIAYLPIYIYVRIRVCVFVLCLRDIYASFTVLFRYMTKMNEKKPSYIYVCTVHESIFVGIL